MENPKKPAISISFPGSAPVLLTQSRFFGKPVYPASWKVAPEAGTIFLAMLNLEEISQLYKHPKLPEKGFLYIYLDISSSIYQPEPTILYSKLPPIYTGDYPDPSLLNEHPILKEAKAIELSLCEPNQEGCKLFGEPCDWNHPDPAPELLLTLDHMDETFGYAPQIDGFTYFFFGEESDLSDVSIQLEYS